MSGKQSLEKAKKDLLNLEINTIIKDRIEGIDMESPAQAIQDVSEGYDAKVDEICQFLQQIGIPAATINAEDWGELPVELTLESALHFGAISSDVKQLMIHIESEEVKWMNSGRYDEAKYHKLQNHVGHLSRMHRNSHQLESILKDEANFSGGRFVPGYRALVSIRKIWEIGTEDIVMQTVVQLDGDVITRITPEYAKADHTAVHQFHHSGVKLSVEQWGRLLDLAKSIFGSLTDRMFG